ncbi:endoglucanase 15-like [Pollicipes pollicipes]|uniref:endoglucanase 15-like n=1 Tax=Pollicipes pollicipes TaxID=41117 RepID=UPI00188526BB|nr:endoglucanase 15-like [Pollicipes pollicipes]
MASLLPLLLLAAAGAPAVHAAGACVSSGIVQETNVWNEGMSANLMLTFPNAVSSWTVEMTFDKTLTKFETWAATASSTDNTVFTLKNNAGDGTQPAGAKMALAFNAYFSSKAEVISVKLDGAELCPGGGGSTTPKPTGPTVPPPTGPTKPPPDLPYDYRDVLGKSLLFYEAQRSGALPPDNRIPWRGNSAMNDRGQNGEDLTGGYYDAGDHVKFGFPMAAAMTVMAWGAIDFADAYADAGQSDYVKAAVKWGTDFFIKAHVGATDFYGQVREPFLADHSVWGRAEDMNMDRPGYKISAGAPGSDLAGETAAAMAAASILFKDSDAAYSGQLLDHAKQLYDFANTHRGKYQDSITDAVSFYGSSGYGDELAWAAAWLYRATQDSSYLDAAKGFFQEFSDLNGKAGEFSWDSKHVGVQLLMYTLTKDSQYGDLVTQFCDWIVSGAPRTPKGLVWLNQWGSLRHAGNVAFICVAAAKAGLNPDSYRQMAEQQLNYIFGDSGRSYVVGFGNNPPVRAHHAGASCPNAPAPCSWDQLNSPNPNPQVLYGALVGGPDINDNYADDRNDYVKNEVACDYNAGFQSAIAGVLSMH